MRPSILAVTHTGPTSLSLAHRTVFSAINAPDSVQCLSRVACSYFFTVRCK